MDENDLMEALLKKQDWGIVFMAIVVACMILGVLASLLWENIFITVGVHLLVLGIAAGIAWYYLRQPKERRKPLAKRLIKGSLIFTLAPIVLLLALEMLRLLALLVLEILRNTNW